MQLWQGKPARTLEAFAKTGLLRPGGSQILTCIFPKKQLASYDDSGITGHCVGKLSKREL